LLVTLKPADGGWTTFDANYLLLAPRETVTVGCEPAGAAVQVSGLNVGPLTT